MAGWSEKVLDIDLNTQTYKMYPLDMEIARSVHRRSRIRRTPVVGYGWTAGRTTFSRKCFDLHQRSAHWNGLSDEQSFFGDNEESINRNGAGCKLRWLLGNAVQEGWL